MGEFGSGDGLAGPTRGGEILGHGFVEADTFAGQEVGVGHLRQQSVAEPEGARPIVGLQNPVGDGLSSCFDQDVVAESGHGREQSIVRPRTGHGCDTKDPLRLRSERRDTGNQDVPQGSRDEVRGRSLAHTGVASEQLFREEGIALGTRMDSLDEPAGRLPSEDSGQLTALLLEVKRAELDPPDIRQAGKFGEAEEQGMTPDEVVSPVRPNDEDAIHPEIPGEKREEVAGRRVAPMEILEPDHERPRGAEARDQGKGQLEQASLPGRRGSCGRGHGGGRDSRVRVAGLDREVRREVGDQRDKCRADLAHHRRELGWRQLGSELPEGCEERPVRQSVAAEIDAAPDQDASVGPSGVLGELGDET
ncbi:MAG TPA: hypothetical protein VFT20_13000 [Candidatus Limnocylindrales bacterium]|nr:hypothetical protein [Candidatus Limnocylindrales bacterium]